MARISIASRSAQRISSAPSTIVAKLRSRLLRTNKETATTKTVADQERIVWIIPSSISTGIRNHPHTP